MKKWISFLFITVLIIAIGSSNLAAREDRQKPQSKFDKKKTEYVQLQPLIDATPQGGQLLLEAVAYEGPIVITKPITITGVDGTSIHSEQDEITVHIQSDNVKLTNLHIEDKQLGKQQATISVEGTGIELSHLDIRTQSTAIKSNQLTNSTIVHNQISWNGLSRTKLNARGNGMQIYNATEVTFKDNTISGLIDGIYIENANLIQITQNDVKNSRYAYHLMYANQVELTENKSNANFTGIMVMTSSAVNVSHNELSKQSENVNAQGILVFDSHDVHISNNRIADNRVALYIEDANQNSVTNNVIDRNFIGIQLDNSKSIHIERNNFIGNVSHILSDTKSEHQLQGNYWDSFQGLDLDGDRYSELSYAASPFFQQIMNRKPAFQLFFGTTGLAFIEQLYEADRSSWIADAKPSLVQLELPASEQKVGFQPGMLIFWTFLLSLAILIIYQSRRRET